jgi:hypothetical protein
MTVSIQINGTDLNPQPSSVTWKPNPAGGKLDGTTHLGAYHLLELVCVPTPGGSSNFNWTTFENTVLTSIRAYAPGDDGQDGTPVTYNSGVVSRPIEEIRSEGGGILRGIKMTVAVVI